MKIIEAPNEYKLKDDELGIFLAGGIPNCPDWQSDMIILLEEKLKDFKYKDSIVIFNPRRANFDVSEISESEAQITWEYKYLNESYIIPFWFPCETLCPITLYELGSHAGDLYSTVLVGCHPWYKRKFDVELQLKLKVGSKIKVVDSLEALADKIVNNVVMGEYAYFEMEL